MRPITLLVSAPCQASWETMTPTAAGRYCAACAKTVVDFSQKTDAEILQYLVQASQAGVCGRLRADQVGRALTPTAEASPAVRGRAWLGALLAASSLAPLGLARATVRTGQPVALVASDPSLAAVAASLPAAETLASAGSYRVEGVVLDAQTHEPIFGATVLIQGAGSGMSTDKHGKFVLSSTTNQAKIILLISSVGYETHRQEIDLKAALEPLIIQLETNKYILGGLGFVSPPPTLWQRVTRLFA